MSKEFVWDASIYGLNIPEMDNEHQILISKMNKLMRSKAEGKAFLDLKDQIGDLANFTKKHFKDEESFMEKIQFPGLATHKMLHQRLLEELNGHVDNFMQMKVLDDTFFIFLSMWLVTHIKGIDMKYSKFSKSS